jgi:hypothetical protein
LLVAAGGFVVLVVAAVLVVPGVMKGGAKQGAGSGIVTGQVADSSKKIDSVGLTGSANVRPPAGADSATKFAKPSSSVPSGGRVDVDQELRSAEQDAAKDESAVARTLLDRMDRLEPRLRVANDSIRVALVRYSAYLTLQSAPSACAALAKVKDRAVGTSFENRVNGKLEACQ